MHTKEWDDVAEKVNFNLEMDCPTFQKHVSSTSRILDLGCGYGRNCDVVLFLKNYHTRWSEDATEYKGSSEARYTSYPRVDSELGTEQKGKEK